MEGARVASSRTVLRVAASGKWAFTAGAAFLSTTVDM
jgi:hypothetical protein